MSRRNAISRAIAYGVAVFAIVFLVACNRAASEATPSRLMGNQVCLANVGEFERQIRADIPVGTPSVEVERYLRSIALNYWYADEDGTGLGNSYYANRLVGRWILMPAEMRIRIQLDGSRRVDKIEFEVFYYAP